MIYAINARKDTSIYENNRILNTGDDEILELSKALYPTTNSRMLLQFDMDAVSESIASGEYTGSAFYLKLSATEPMEIPLEYTIMANAISGSWESGVGSFYNVTSSVLESSWKWSDSSNEWATASYATNTTGSYITYPGGATWYTSSAASQSFSYGPSDLRMDITNIVGDWISGSIPNEGLIVRRTVAAEEDSLLKGSLKFFSRNTNTIYQPKLQIAWDDSIHTPGPLTELTEEDIVVYPKSMKARYQTNSKGKFRIIGRERYPAKTFATSSAYREIKYLPSSTYYSIQDSITEEQVISFDDIYTKVSCDTTGNYFNLWTGQFAVERWYNINIKVVRDGTVQLFDAGAFKVVR